MRKGLSAPSVLAPSVAEVGSWITSEVPPMLDWFCAPSVISDTAPGSNCCDAGAHDLLASTPMTVSTVTTASAESEIVAGRSPGPLSQSAVAVLVMVSPLYCQSAGRSRGALSTRLSLRVPPASSPIPPSTGCWNSTRNEQSSVTSTGRPPSSTHPSEVTDRGRVDGVYDEPTTANPANSAGTVSVSTTFRQSTSSQTRSIVYVNSSPGPSAFCVSSPSTSLSMRRDDSAA